MGRGKTLSKLLLSSVFCVCLCVLASWYMLTKILDKAKEITTEIAVVAEDINEIATSLPSSEPTKRPQNESQK